MSTHRANMSTEDLEAMRVVAITAGQRIARKAFAKRGNHSEVHLDEATLAAMLAVAFEQGYEARDSQLSGPESPR